MDKDDKQLKQWVEEHPALLNSIVIGAVILLIISLTMVIRDGHLRGSVVDSADPVCDCRCSKEDQQ